VAGQPSGAQQTVPGYVAGEHSKSLPAPLAVMHEQVAPRPNADSLHFVSLAPEKLRHTAAQSVVAHMPTARSLPAPPLRLASSSQAAASRSAQPSSAPSVAEQLPSLQHPSIAG
jgi:hypothetical protein